MDLRHSRRDRRDRRIFPRRGAALPLGGELQLEVLPTDWLELSGSYQYLMARYTKYPSIDPVTLVPLDLKDRTFPYAPRHNGNLTVKVNLPVPESLGQVSVQGTLMLMSKFVGVSDGAPLIAVHGRGLPPWWVFALAIPLSMVGTAAGGLVLNRLSDVNFKRYLRLILTVIGVAYLIQAGHLLIQGG